jgi:predicted amidophosphoribosyltransferase
MALLELRYAPQEERLMAEFDTLFCPVCKADMEFVARHYIWRCTEHGLFHHYQLEPQEQIKIGEFTWMRKNGETYVDRPAYPG